MSIRYDLTRQRQPAIAGMLLALCLAGVARAQSPPSGNAPGASAGSTAGNVSTGSATPAAPTAGVVTPWNAPPLPGGGTPLAPVGGAFSGGGAGTTPSGAFSGLAMPPAVRLGGASGVGFPGYAPTGLLPGASAATARAFSVVPSIGLQEMATDNVFGTATDHSSDLVTTITPGLLLNADSARLQGTLNYAPNLQFYARNSDQNYAAQQLNGQALLTVVPDLLFLNMQAFVGQQSATGGLNPSGTAVLNQSNSILNQTYAVSPYISHRFGGVGTLQAGYSFSYTSQTGNTYFLPGVTQPSFSNNNQHSNEEFGSFTTGENFGRFQLRVLVDARQSGGTGIAAGSSQFLSAVSGGYAVNRLITLLAEGGYETLDYPNGIPPVNISGGVWSTGVRLTPGPDSVLVARYVHRYNLNSPYLSAVLAPTARIRVFGNYTDFVGTQAEALQGNLAASTLNNYGQPVSATTGVPVLLNDLALGAQTSLQRTRTASAGVSVLFDRDTVSASYLYQNSTVISQSAGQFAYAQENNSVSLTWTHQIDPDTTASAYAQVGNTTGGGPSGGSYALNLALRHIFTETLSGSVQYLLTRNASGLVAGSSSASDAGVQNAVLVTLQKTF